MRAPLWGWLLSIAILLPGFCDAGAVRTEMAISKDGNASGTDANEKSYRGYYLDLSEIAKRQDFAEIATALWQQLDIVEGVGLSPRVLNFFHTVPIVADEVACLEKELAAAACYGSASPKRSQPTSREFTVWDGEKHQWTNSDAIGLASDTRGVVMVRPLLTFEAKNPVMLHELLHAFHAQIMPQGFQNEGVLFHFNQAKSKQLYPADKYLMKNQQEFFAVTASIFLYGEDAAHEPFTRSNLKEKQPDYFKYLVGLFEFDPDHAPGASPVASAH
jgi:hypothetical protein